MDESIVVVQMDEGGRLVLFLYNLEKHLFSFQIKKTSKLISRENTRKILSGSYFYKTIVPKKRTKFQIGHVLNQHGLLR